jgi:glycine/D-amino acid oxidase-like deaminating enzyme
MIRVLLIGAGRFGRHYLRILSGMHEAGELRCVGVVVHTTESAERLRSETTLPVFDELTDQLLDEADAIFITTPPDTHHELLQRCIPHAHVYVEKPVTMTLSEAESVAGLVTQSGNTLMVGHTFRFHPLTHELRALVGTQAPPRSIAGAFINPLATDQARDASLELLHLYDVLLAIWPDLTLNKVARRDVGRLSKLSLQCANGTLIRLELGWLAEEKTRTLTFIYPDRRIEADFASHTLTITDASGSITSHHAPPSELLQHEVLTFLAVCRGEQLNPVPIEVARTVIGWAERASVDSAAVRPVPALRRPRVAIIGGGVFGCAAAVALAPDHDVVVFEKNRGLLKEGAWANNFRHHAGYHYPRSDDTVRDVQSSAGAFETRYKQAIVGNVPNYYGIAREGSHVSYEQFVAFCERNHLPYNTVTDPTPFFSDTVGAVVRVEEPVYHYDSLVRLITDEVRASGATIRTATPVRDVSILADGTKQVVFTADGATSTETFDIVVNATYAALNWFTHALGVESVPLRIDWAEVPIVHLEHPPLSLTVIDGPFACMLPTGNPHEFTIYHVVHSVLDRYTPEDGQIRPRHAHTTNALAILHHSIPHLPLLAQAVLKESRQVHRGVQAYREHDDRRVAEIYDHGFDCYSILSGKIVSSVALSERLAAIIRHHRAPNGAATESAG